MLRRRLRKKFLVNKVDHMNIKFDNKKQFEIFCIGNCMADFINNPKVPNNNCSLGEDQEECKRCWKDNTNIVINSQ